MQLRSAFRADAASQSYVVYSLYVVYSALIFT